MADLATTESHVATEPGLDSVIVSLALGAQQSLAMLLGEQRELIDACAGRVALNAMIAIPQYRRGRVHSAFHLKDIDKTVLLGSLCDTRRRGPTRSTPLIKLAGPQFGSTSNLR